MLRTLDTFQLRPFLLSSCFSKGIKSGGSGDNGKHVRNLGMKMNMSLLGITQNYIPFAPTCTLQTLLRFLFCLVVQFMLRNVNGYYSTTTCSLSMVKANSYIIQRLDSYQSCANIILLKESKTCHSHTSLNLSLKLTKDIGIRNMKEKYFYENNRK